MRKTLNGTSCPHRAGVETLEFPAAHAGRRIDTGVRAGDQITPYYDPMIAKIIGGGDNRSAAIETLESIRIDGLKTNLRFLANVLRHPAFAAGELHTHFIETHREELQMP